MTYVITLCQCFSIWLNIKKIITCSFKAPQRRNMFGIDWMVMKHNLTWRLTRCKFCLKNLTRNKVVVSTTQFPFSTAPCSVYKTHTHTHNPNTLIIWSTNTGHNKCRVSRSERFLRGTAPANRSGWLFSSLCFSSVWPQLVGPISAMGRFLLAGWWYRAISS